jgi:hypothetical protein
MKDLLALSLPRRRWALLPAIAMMGVLVGLTNAFAWDQQATDDEMDDAINHQAASGGYAGAYGQVPLGGTVYVPRHRQYRQ